MRGCRPAAALLAVLHCSGAAAWDYSHQGRDWGNLGLCGDTGAAGVQSPVNLPASGAQATDVKSMQLKYPYLSIPSTLYASDTSLALTLPESYKGGFGLQHGENGATSTFQDYNSDVYRLWTIEFHSPSEHLISGQRASLEVQLSHKHAFTGAQAMVSVLFDKGEASDFLENVIAAGLPQKPWDEVTVSFLGQGWDLPGLLGGSDDLYYMYNGSLTYPPCDPGVLWMVRQNKVTATAAQMDAIGEVIKSLSPPQGNARMAPGGTTQIVQGINLVPAKDARAATYSQNLRAVPKQVNLDNLPKATPPPPVSAQDVMSDPKMSVYTPQDDKEMRATKSSINNAKLDDTAARVLMHSAERDLDEVKRLYSSAPGLVGKIDLKWTLIDKQNAYNAAKAQASQSHERYKAQAAQAAASISARMLAPAVNDEKKMPTDHAKVPHPRYMPAVSYPTGDVANPFSDNVAESEARIGSGDNQQNRVFQKLAPNGGQPDGPEHAAPLPQVMQPTTTEEPETTTPAPAQIVQSFDLPPGAVTNPQQFARDFALAAAKGTGVDPSRISVGEFRRIALLRARAARTRI